MDKLKVLIVDDEALARQKIRRFLSARSESFEIEEASNGIEALKTISRLEPDLIFLDIEMPELSGFEVLSQLEHCQAKIIFETAHDEFALRAFEENACDYLLKPFTKERFNQALDRVLNQFETQAKLSALEHTVHKGGHWLRHMVAKQGDKYVVIRDEDILCFMSKDHYTSLRTKSKEEYICDLSLNHLEERLDPKAFIRLHRNSIARIPAIRTIKTKSGEAEVVLEDGTTLAVSRRSQKQLKDLFLKL